MSWIQHRAWGMDTDPQDDWTARAACRPGSGVDPEIFHPVGTGTLAQHAEKVAKSWCDTCPVAAECLDFALEQGIEHGIYGGLTEAQRRALQRRHRTGQMAARP